MEMLVFSDDSGVCMSQKQNMILIFSKLTFLGYIYVTQPVGHRTNPPGWASHPAPFSLLVLGVLWAEEDNQETRNSERVFSVRNPLSGSWNIAKVHWGL